MYGCNSATASMEKVVFNIRVSLITTVHGYLDRKILKYPYDVCFVSQRAINAFCKHLSHIYSDPIMWIRENFQSGFWKDLMESDSVYVLRYAPDSLLGTIYYRFKRSFVNCLSVNSQLIC